MKRQLSRVALVCVLCLANTVLVISQAAKKQAFDASTIKISKSNRTDMSIAGRGNRFVATNVTFRELAQFAYCPPDTRRDQFSILGGPSWVDTTRYDIEAVGETAAPAARDNMAERVQSLLEERFMLRMHIEKEDLTAYQLVVGKAGPRLHLSANQTPTGPQTDVNRPGSQLPPGKNGNRTLSDQVLSRGSIRFADNEIEGAAITVSKFAAFLSRELAAPVTDRTNFPGLIDVKLHVQPNLVPPRSSTSGILAGRGLTASSRISVPSLIAAVKELGLELEPIKATGSVFTIESVQYPSEN